jgi:hypothetical protein
VVSKSARASPANRLARFFRSPTSIGELQTSNDAPSCPITRSFLLIFVGPSELRTILVRKLFVQPKVVPHYPDSA